MILKDKKMTGFYLLFSLIIIIAGCSQNGNRGIKTTIKGSLPAFKGKSVSLSEFDINMAIPLDTVKIDEDGSFSFSFRRTGPGFYLVKIDNKNYLTLVLDKEKRVEIFSDKANLRKDYHLQGSADSELYRDFEMFLEVNRSKVDSLSRTYSDYQRSATFRSVKMELDKSYQDIFAHQRQFSISLLENHCNSLATLLVINRRFGERKILTEEKDFQYFILIDSCLSIRYPDNKHLVELKRKIGIFNEQLKLTELTKKRLATGNNIPDIGLQNPAGETVQLHSLRGKPILLYFWASWDQGSRKANLVTRELIKMAGKGKPAVYAIGLESYKEAWENAIRDDGLQEWTHVTDYLNIHSSAKTMFNIPDELPYFILIDNNLVIILKGSDLGELENKIKELKQ